VLVDRPGQKVHFIIPGSASPEIIRNASEALTYLLEHLPLQMYLILANREDSDLPLAHTSLAGPPDNHPHGIFDRLARNQDQIPTAARPG
jgi:hypothetical protein